MSTINENFLVDFMGNAPVGFYVDDSDPNTTNKVVSEMLNRTQAINLGSCIFLVLLL